jgi:hypothetical protein
MSEEEDFDPVYTAAELALLVLRLTNAIQSHMKLSFAIMGLMQPGEKPPEFVKEVLKILTEETPKLNGILADCLTKSQVLADDLVGRMSRR